MITKLDRDRDKLGFQRMVSSTMAQDTVLTENMLIDLLVGDMAANLIQWARDHHDDQRSPFRDAFQIRIEVEPVKITSLDEDDG